MVCHSHIRPASRDDVRLLFEWRNDVSTRRMFKSKDVVLWEDHVSWLDRRLKLEQPNLFVFEVDGIPVGTFRIDDHDLSYTVAPRHRNRGLAKLMLNEVRVRFGRLRAEIYADNLPSIRAATAAGMEVVVIDG